MAKLTLKPEDYAKLDQLVRLQDGEFYSVVTHRIRGKFVRSIHVFARQPTTKELLQYEETVSRVKIRGTRTDVEGSQIKAAKDLYDMLISRAYDVPQGWQIHGEVSVGKDGALSGQPLGRNDAIAVVSAMIKREAVRDFVGEHYSESRVAEMEGDEEVKGKEDD